MNASPSVIVLDDDLASLRELTAQFSPKYAVQATTDYHKAMRCLESDRAVKIFLVAQSFKRVPWTQILEEVRSLRPSVKRILQTPFGDLSEIMPSLHDGAIDHIVSKPTNAGEFSRL